MKAHVQIIAALAVAACVADAWAADGRELFETHCIPCHGLDGKGRTPAGKKIGAKDLTESKISDADIAKQIIEGTKDAKGNARMPTFREKLSADDVTALVSFVKTFRK